MTLIILIQTDCGSSAQETRLLVEQLCVAVKSSHTPVSCDGDGEAVVLFPRILHARHFGVDREAISGFTVELLQETKRTDTQ